MSEYTKMTEYKFMAELGNKFKYYPLNSVVRIETGATEIGVPDMFVTLVHSAYGQATWIECKQDLNASIRDDTIRVQWRAGQQVFADDYRNATSIEHPAGTAIMYTWTALRCCDGVLFIPMYKTWKDNKIKPQDIDILKVNNTAWYKLTGLALARELWYNRVMAVTRYNKAYTVGDYCIMYTRIYNNMLMRAHKYMRGISSVVTRQAKPYMKYEWNHVLTREEFRATEVYMSAIVRRVMSEYIDKQL